MKIGRYTEDEILEHLTKGEGRGFLGRSMYDAIFDKIHSLITENEQLKTKIDKYENPKDLTLMYMFCDEKAKDKIKELQNRIDKAIEYTKNKWYEKDTRDIDNMISLGDWHIDLLKILKGEK